MDTSPPPHIREDISYDPLTGLFWRLKAAGNAHVGDRADAPTPRGYRRVRFAGKEYSAHRLAWFFIKGEWPPLLVDHRNLDKGDNRFSNLRLATYSQNTINAMSKGSLPRGVTLHRGVGKFQAQIKADGKNHYLGLFETPEQAHAAYVSASQELHGEFARAA